MIVRPKASVERYPDDEHLAASALVGYAGYPLNDAAGRAVGDASRSCRGSRSINAALVEAVLKIFAVRAEAEIERRAHEEALAGSAGKYRAIFKAAADATSMVAAARRRSAWSTSRREHPGYEAMSGRRREEVLGRRQLTMSLAYTQRATCCGLHRGARSPARSVMLRVACARKNGERFHIETRGVPSRHAGKPHVLYIGRDITARESARRRCARARSSTAPSSTPPPTRWCCATPTSASSTSTPPTSR